MINLNELFKIVIACLILSTFLSVLGAEQWVSSVCCFGMALFWKKGPSTEKNP